MPSSLEWWSISNLDGTEEQSLHEYGWSVTTVGGSRYDLPPKRGEDMTIAYRPGQIHRRKIPDARQITLLMFMVGWEPGTGLLPADGDQLTQWNDNWDFLRRLVYRTWVLPDHRVRLNRRWFLTAPTFPTARSGEICIQGDPGVPDPGKRLLWAFGNAEMTGSMAPDMTGRFRSEFQMDFTMADPYFFGEEVTVVMHTGIPHYVWNDGHDAVGGGYIYVDLAGPLINPVITNYSTQPDSWVKWKGTVGVGETIRLVVNKFTCERVLSSGNQNRIGNISSYGSRFWVALIPGANKIQLSADAGSGHATLVFRPPYL